MRCQDHPHACGDKFEVLPLVSLSLGSSPRVWGQDNMDTSTIVQIRIIPTRMGTSFCMCSKRQASRDHPHAYGDKLGFPIACCVAMGSSPRVWGQVSSDLYSIYGFGIIPTRMGTSRLPRCKNKLKRDHPHAYGDKCSKRASLISARGSSPRVWGQENGNAEARVKEGIIPTRMGTSRDSE